METDNSWSRRWLIQDQYATQSLEIECDKPVVTSQFDALKESLSNVLTFGWNIFNVYIVICVVGSG